VLLLLLGCAPPALPGADETATDESGAADCTVPPNEDVPGSPQTIVLTNVGGQPIFVIPDRDCGDSIFHDLSVDGAPIEDDVMETCSTLAEHSCDSCDESDYGHAPIRIDPGASVDWTFDGYAYEMRSFASECEIMAACWSGEDCPVGATVAAGASITAELMTTEECLAADECQCPAGQNACELPLLVASEELLGEPQPLTFEFTHLGDEMPVVELGG
jgi:hypothetical protein